MKRRNSSFRLNEQSFQQLAIQGDAGTYKRNFVERFDLISGKPTRKPVFGKVKTP
jgi:hypothetical protein